MFLLTYLLMGRQHITGARIQSQADNRSCMKKPGSFSGWLHVFVMSYDGANVNYSEMTTDAFDVEQQLRVPSREPVSRHRCQSCCQLNSLTAQRD